MHWFKQKLFKVTRHVSGISFSRSSRLRTWIHPMPKPMFFPPCPEVRICPGAGGVYKVQERRFLKEVTEFDICKYLGRSAPEWWSWKQGETKIRFHSFRVCQSLTWQERVPMKCHEVLLGQEGTGTFAILKVGMVGSMREIQFLLPTTAEHRAGTE